MSNFQIFGPGSVGFRRQSLLAIFLFPFRRAGDRFDTTETGSQSRTSCVERDVGVNCQGRDPSELAERLGQALKDEAELNTAVSRLMKARQDK